MFRTQGQGVLIFLGFLVDWVIMPIKIVSQKYHVHLVLAVIVLFAAALLGAIAVIGKAKAEDNKSVIAYLVHWDQPRGMEIITREQSAITEVSPVWYKLTPQGNITPHTKWDGSSAVDPAVITSLRSMGKRIVPTLQNIVNGSWDAGVPQTILTNPALRTAHVNEIVSIVNTNGYDGIDIDYETLPGSLRDPFSAFIQELSSALHAHGKILAVNVYPKTFEPGWWDGPQGQDWAVIGAAADQVRIMMYGYSWEDSAPGPIAPASWGNDILTFAASVIPPHKVIAGTPLYGIDWPNGQVGIEATWQDLEAIRTARGALLRFDTTHQSPWFTYSSGGITHTAWYENASSTDAKLAIAVQKNIGGITLWRIGGEDPLTWNVIRARFGGNTPPPPPTPVPSATLLVNGTSTVNITSTSSVTVAWSSLNVTSCTLAPYGWTGTTQTGSSSPMMSTSTTLMLTCSGLYGTATASAQVTATIIPVTPNPSADLKINGSDNPITVDHGTSVTLAWISTDAATCTVQPFNLSGTTQSNITSPALTSTTTVTLTCTNSTGTASDSIVVGVRPAVVPTDTIAPSVTITAPQQNATIPKNQRLNISVNASDNIGVTRVLIYGNDALIATDLAAPYTAQWNTRGISAGTHTIRAVAYDAAGNSSTVSVQVIK